MQQRDQCRGSLFTREEAPRRLAKSVNLTISATGQNRRFVGVPCGQSLPIKARFQCNKTLRRPCAAKGRKTRGQKCALRELQRAIHRCGGAVNRAIDIDAPARVKDPAQRERRHTLVTAWRDLARNAHELRLFPCTSAGFDIPSP
jgi:hypothetical protein